MQTGRPDVAALRQAIDERLRGRAAFSEVSYGDQPIVFSGRQLKSYVPQRLSDARALARSPEMLRHSEAYVFWRQAQLLADYEDDYDFHGHFSRYYPTYEVMSNDQLRGYFAWRTEWRAGVAPDTETSFVYVLAYELLMGVGAADARDGYAQLARLCEDYGDLDPHVVQNLGRWMDDYIVYWGLPADLLGSLAHREADRALGVLLHRRDHADGELFAAMEALSSYHMGKSVFYKGHAEDVQRVAVRVYRAMADHHDRDLKRSLVETYFGVSLEQDYVLFYEDYTYEVSPLDHFRCRGARWSRDRYAGNLRPNRKLGALLKTIDATMRELYGFKPALQAPLTTKYVLKLIETETDALLAARAEAERRPSWAASVRRRPRPATPCSWTRTRWRPSSRRMRGGSRSRTGRVWAMLRLRPARQSLQLRNSGCALRQSSLPQPLPGGSAPQMTLTHPVRLRLPRSPWDKACSTSTSEKRHPPHRRHSRRVRPS